MKILLVKLSSLGDVVHTLPVVQDILAALPEAQIDWVIEEAFAPLLTQVSGLRRIIPCALRRWRNSLLTPQTRTDWRAFRFDLQQDSYDAVIDLQGLTKSAVVARLAMLTPDGKRYAMANQTTGSGYEAPTRWLADVAIPLESNLHAVARGRLLAAAALGYSTGVSNQVNYGLNMPLAHINRAQSAPEIIAKVKVDSIVFIHGTSRQDKCWPLQSWVELGQLMMASGYQITLVHGSAAELVTSQTIAAQLAGSTVLPLLALGALAKEMNACAGAIGVDSGVSHIAVALGLPLVQIYNFDTAWRTGPLSCAHQLSVFGQPVPTVDAVWQAWCECVKEGAKERAKELVKVLESRAP